MLNALLFDVYDISKPLYANLYGRILLVLNVGSLSKIF